MCLRGIVWGCPVVSECSAHGQPWHMACPGPDQQREKRRVGFSANMITHSLSFARSTRLRQWQGRISASELSAGWLVPGLYSRELLCVVSCDAFARRMALCLWPTVVRGSAKIFIFKLLTGFHRLQHAEERAHLAPGLAASGGIPSWDQAPVRAKAPSPLPFANLGPIRLFEINP